LNSEMLLFHRADLTVDVRENRMLTS
jgi:hypothetical protein